MSPLLSTADGQGTGSIDLLALKLRQKIPHQSPITQNRRIRNHTHRLRLGPFRQAARRRSRRTRSMASKMAANLLAGFGARSRLVGRRPVFAPRYPSLWKSPWTITASFPNPPEFSALRRRPANANSPPKLQLWPRSPHAFRQACRVSPIRSFGWISCRVRTSSRSVVAGRHDGGAARICPRTDTNSTNRRARRPRPFRSPPRTRGPRCFSGVGTGRKCVGVPVFKSRVCSEFPDKVSGKT